MWDMAFIVPMHRNKTNITYLLRKTVYILKRLLAFLRLLGPVSVADISAMPLWSRELIRLSCDEAGYV